MSLEMQHWRADIAACDGHLDIRCDYAVTGAFLVRMMEMCTISSTTLKRHGRFIIPICSTTCSASFKSAVPTLRARGSRGCCAGLLWWRDGCYTANKIRRGVCMSARRQAAV